MPAFAKTKSSLLAWEKTVLKIRDSDASSVTLHSWNAAPREEAMGLPVEGFRSRMWIDQSGCWERAVATERPIPEAR